MLWLFWYILVKPDSQYDGDWSIFSLFPRERIYVVARFQVSS